MKTRCELNMVLQDEKLLVVTCQMDQTNDDGWVKSANWNPVLSEGERKSIEALYARLLKEGKPK